MTVSEHSSAGLEEFTKEVQSWMEENVPHDIEYIRDAQKMSYEQFKMHRDLMRSLGARGWLWPTESPEYGGGGLDAAHGSVIRAALAERRLGLPPLLDFASLAAPAVQICGTEEQKKRFLPPMFTGNGLTWQLFTEPEAGTDVANQQTNALRYTRDGEDFIINGQKIFVGAIFPPPDFFFLLTRSDVDGPRHANLSSFICPADLPGITIQPLDLFTLSPFTTISGVSGATVDAIKNSIFFDNVRVHESRLIGAEGEGWKVTQTALSREHGVRGGGGAASARTDDDVMALRSRFVEARNCSYMGEQFLAECKTNPGLVKRLKENPQLVDKLVDSYTFFQTERVLSIRDREGLGGVHGGPELMLFVKRGGARFGGYMASIFGPYALTDDPELTLGEGIFEVGERCSICQAPSGTPEALKIIISRALAIGRPVA